MSKLFEAHNAKQFVVLSLHVICNVYNYAEYFSGSEKCEAHNMNQLVSMCLQYNWSKYSSNSSCFHGCEDYVCVSSTLHRFSVFPVVCC